VDLIVNGVVQDSVVIDEDGPPRPAGTPDVRQLEIPLHAAIPEGGWIAVRVRGPASPYLGDSFAFAQTSPVYVSREGQPPYVSTADAMFLADVVDAIWARVERVPWRTDAERAAFKADIDRARQTYLERASRGR
jgi:hypothetical protein